MQIDINNENSSNCKVAGMYIGDIFEKTIIKLSSTS